jgi:GTP cyclohydrolase I
MIDKKAIEEHIRGILVALGDDPEREGLKDTPKRVLSKFNSPFPAVPPHEPPYRSRLP